MNYFFRISQNAAVNAASESFPTDMQAIECGAQVAYELWAKHSAASRYARLTPTGSS